MASRWRWSERALWCCATGHLLGRQPRMWRPGSCFRVLRYYVRQDYQVSHWEPAPSWKVSRIVQLTCLCFRNNRMLLGWRPRDVGLREIPDFHQSKVTSETLLMRLEDASKVPRRWWWRYRYCTFKTGDPATYDDYASNSSSKTDCYRFMMLIYLVIDTFQSEHALVDQGCRSGLMRYRTRGGKWRW